MDRYTVRGHNLRGATIVEFEHVPFSVLAETLDSVVHTLHVKWATVQLEEDKRLTGSGRSNLGRGEQ